MMRNGRMQISLTVKLICNMCLVHFALCHHCTLLHPAIRLPSQPIAISMGVGQIVDLVSMNNLRMMQIMKDEMMSQCHRIRQHVKRVIL